MLKIKRIIPRYTQVVTTAERYEKDERNGTLIVGNGHLKGDVKQYQTVVAIGKMAREIEVGSKVMLDFEPFRKRKVPVGSVKEKMNVDNPVIEERLPIFEVEDDEGITKEYLMVDEKNIVFPFEGEEVEDGDDTSRLVLPKHELVV